MKKLNKTSTEEFKNSTVYQFFNKLMEECYSSTASKPTPHDRGSFCPRIFDGFTCWDETPAATTVYKPCPDFIVGFDTRRTSFKRCSENGTWELHPESLKAWTNYTTCVDVEDLEFRSYVNDIYVTGYAISIVALIISLMVLKYLKALQCTRVSIHMQLFISFTFHNVLWIIWYKCVVSRVEVVKNNTEWCQVLHVLTNYFMLASYIWMFCAGLHLHLSLVVVFVKEKAAMHWFMCLGWLLPVLIIAAYAAVRILSDETQRCWMESSNINWIINVPVIICLVSSCVFLANVLRVLATKLHPGQNRTRAMTAKKIIRAACILIPLFGLHFLLIPFRPPPESPSEKFYQIFAAIMTSLQGFCMAVLFCFTNQDVINALKNQINKIMCKKEAPATTAATRTTAGENVMLDTREDVV
ncbi:calcitonin gene-related peptide type 1 receptor-like [Battus philenor]|uniref:calcitonin gene-related peptide type 1 receptor-like n=1 Tax=Battus philenor TaxID=42288 RepID=UPI0035CED767